ncbi:hypothetical protein Y1Q_0013482 [Alligator mississippiensis]|uniref:Regulator of G-protein signaling 22 n=2 Tax=Alligator mississippiensis TaxID=8496 RepID=A0A151P2W5_ALLMI|nr:hypothetical protein Y1Q_0013482 [Alligator mississippiensis]
MAHAAHSTRRVTNKLPAQEVPATPVGTSVGAKAHGLEVLEDLLTYDDLFLEYFNAFLAQPAFPLRLHYDRLRGQLEELDGFLQECPRQLSSPQYGASDAERERTLGWLQRERLVPFLGSTFYLQYKLAKLLMCPLDEGYPVSRHEVRGYSRQSDSAAVSSIPSHPSTAGLTTGIPSHELLRPLRLTRSTPARLGCLVDNAGWHPQEISLEFSAAFGLGQLPCAEGLSRLQVSSLLYDSSMEATNGETAVAWRGTGRDCPLPEGAMDDWTSEPAGLPVGLSTPASGSSLGAEQAKSHLDRWAGESFSDARKVLQFDLDEASDSEGGEEPGFLGSFRDSALQRLKEDILGTRAGMDTFQEFLQGTLGIHLFHFWIDCEHAKERAQCLEASDAQLLYTDLFRSIQDKYKLDLPPASQEQIYEAQHGAGQTSAAISRSQYDALRRLRSYWVPRFLIHHERAKHLGRLASDLGSQAKASSLLHADHLPSVKVFTALPIVGDRCMSRVSRSRDWLSVLRSAGTRRGRIESAQPPGLMWPLTMTPLTSRLLQTLKCDLGGVGGFLHYLIRYEDAQEVHSLLLWQALEEHKASWERQADRLQVHRAAWHIFHTYLAHDAGCDVGLGYDMPLYVQHLQDLLSTSDGGLEPMAFEPVAQHVLAVLCGSWLCYLRYEIATFLKYCVPASFFEAQDMGSKESRTKQERRNRARKRRSNARSHAQEGREHQRQKKKTASNPLGSGLAEEDTPASRVSVTSQPSPDLLSNKVVFKVYRKVAQEMQDADLQRALGLLQNLECCWEAPGDRQRLGSTLKLLDLWDQQGSESANPQLPQKLRKRLRVEVAQGRVSDLSLEEMQAALYSHVAQSFEGFWAVVSEGLSRHGVQHTHLQEEGWAKLEPLLHSLAAKVALKHLRNRKAQVGSAATARPSQEDKASFCRSLRAAAEGWPSLEMLHFLQYLQVHGPPVLETGLCFQLEVQKFKNAHHGTPNGALLRKKVQVIRDSFLLSQLEPRLQVAVDAEKLERAVQAAEQALQKDAPLPPPSLFDELRDSVFSSLLPYWACFQKAWLQRSPTSAQRAPVLRAQQLLKQRCAWFEKPQGLRPTFQLPPLQQPAAVRGNEQQDNVTYTFSVSRGIALKASSRESTASISTNTSGLRHGKRSARFRLPPIPKIPAPI